MIGVLMTVLLNLVPATNPGIVETCVWPNPCAAPIAQYQPCVWPNTCSAPESVLAQSQPCVWPNPCAQATNG